MGVALVICGLTMSTFGMQFLRISELRKKDEKLRESRNFFILGMAMNVFFGPLCDVAGYAFATAAVIAPFSGFNIVINAVVAPFTLGEKLTTRRLFASVMVFITATISIFFKNQNEDEEVWTLERAEEILLRWTVLVYGLMFAMWFFLNMWLRKRSPKGSVHVVHAGGSSFCFRLCFCTHVQPLGALASMDSLERSTIFRRGQCSLYD